MTGIRTVRTLIKDIAQGLPGFRVKGRLLFFDPVRYLLRGLSFGSSAYTKDLFYPSVFVQPLYLPVDYIFLTFGDRLRAGDHQEGWEFTPEIANEVREDVLNSIRQQALPFLDTIKEPIDLALACETYPQPSATRFSWPTDDINVMESAAYSWLVAGNARKCLEWLNRINRKSTTDPDDRAWAQELYARAKKHSDMLEKGREIEVRDQLDVWTKNCAKALGLESFLELPTQKG
jgi:hypothetical protein